MKIRFLPPDPRAGMVAEFDSQRGRQLVDSGAAEVCTATAPTPVPTPAPAPEPKPPKSKPKA